MTESFNWLGRCARAAAFGIAALLLLTIARIVFFFAYKNDDLGFLSDFAPAMVMGLRVDAKWLAILLLPAWICVLLSYWKAFFWKLARILAFVGMFVTALLTVINFGFYGFYATPISPIIFGFLQDDTKAIVITIMKDWPVFTYLLCLAGFTALPFACTMLLGRSRERRVGRAAYGVLSILSIVVMALVIRGSLGTFPLRIQSYSVTKNAFINATVPNGMAAFHEARKGMQVLELKGGAIAALQQMGFGKASDAEALIAEVRPVLPQSKSLKSQPHVVLAVMESMGRDVFESHKPGVNDTLGALAGELDSALVFKQSLCVGQATFPTLEGLLFDSPLNPITQSRYGRHVFDFSRMLEYKKAGYRTIFLTAGPEAWRQIETNFPQQGFDEIVGAGKLSSRYPGVENGTWGVGDAWMFIEADAGKVDVTRWAGHRDIFPTIAGVVLGRTPEIHEGRNLFANESMDLIVSYTGIAAGSWGAAEIRDNGSVTCYRWENDRMVPEDACTGLSKKMADAARAQRALADYKVRKGLLNEK